MITMFATNAQAMEMITMFATNAQAMEMITTWMNTES